MRKSISLLLTLIMILGIFTNTYAYDNSSYDATVTLKRNTGPETIQQKADMRKRYREVKYGDGTFAYFQTGFFANNLNVAGKSYGSPEAIYSGGLY